MRTSLFTFGYESLDITTFVERLRAQDIKTVIDVRELPLSRKKGFSKKAFAEALLREGIAYLHMPTLGCPKPIREQYKADATWERYTKEFLGYLRSQQAPLRELIKISDATSAC